MRIKTGLAALILPLALIFGMSACAQQDGCYDDGERVSCYDDDDRDDDDDEGDWEDDD